MCDIFGMVRNSWTQPNVHMMYSNSNWCGGRVALEDCNKPFQDEKSTSTVANSSHFVNFTQLKQLFQATL